MSLVDSTFIRRAGGADEEAFYRICLATAAAGRDAAGRYRDPRLPGHLYAAPYLALAPESCLALEDGEGVCGYAVGCADSAAFYRAMERDWLPALRRRYPLDEAGEDADGALIRRLHETPGLAPGLAAFPAHLHIDLLPRAQGAGHGRRLLAALLRRLEEQGATAAHWGVDPANVAALAFYRRLGFSVVSEQPGCLWFGARLSEGVRS